jgi:hypothetical protein
VRWVAVVGGGRFFQLLLSVAACLGRFRSIAVSVLLLPTIFLIH